MSAQSSSSESGLNQELGVLVGFDGSELAAQAVRYGAIEAERRKTVLTVVTAYELPTMIYPNMASIPSEPEDDKAKTAAEKTLAEAVDAPVGVLGRVGLDPALREGADSGVPLVVSQPDSPTSLALKAVARSLVRTPRGLGGMKLPLSVKRS